MSPKDILRQVRDGSIKDDCTQNHTKPIDSHDSVPKNWKKFIGCRTCKYRLVQYLCKASLQLVHHLFTKPEQQLVVSGGFTGNMMGKALGIISGQPNVFEFVSCSSNSNEADSRVWKHALNFQQCLVVSPDTDTYHVGLPLLTSQTIFVQLDMPGSQDHSFISVNSLSSSFTTDPDLQCIPENLKPLTAQVTFIATGCDYVSFFRSLGKTFFFSTLCRYASFITGNNAAEGVPGMLCDTESEDGFLAFVRLVGCAYHSKHTAGFEDNGPRSLLSQQDGATAQQRHSEWLNAIRKVVWSRVGPEEDCPPSWSALHLHWQRVCWVANMWAQANEETVVTLDPNQYGWSTDSNNISIVWDTEEHMAAVQSRVLLLTRGCSCKSGCNTKRCKCYRSGLCGPGCKCTGCKNITPLNSNVNDGNNNQANCEAQDSKGDDHDDEEEDDDDEEDDEEHEDDAVSPAAAAADDDNDEATVHCGDAVLHAQSAHLAVNTPTEVLEEYMEA